MPFSLTENKRLNFSYVLSKAIVWRFSDVGDVFSPSGYDGQGQMAKLFKTTLKLYLRYKGDKAFNIKIKILGRLKTFFSDFSLNVIYYDIISDGRSRFVHFCWIEAKEQNSGRKKKKDGHGEKEER